jgi:hypothetical protein
MPLTGVCCSRLCPTNVDRLSMSSLSSLTQMQPLCLHKHGVLCTHGCGGERPWPRQQQQLDDSVALRSPPARSTVTQPSTSQRCSLLCAAVVHNRHDRRHSELLHLLAVHKLNAVAYDADAHVHFTCARRQVVDHNVYDLALDFDGPAVRVPHHKLATVQCMSKRGANVTVDSQRNGFGH